MKVLIYRPNDQQQYADACRVHAESTYPGSKIQERNPDSFFVSECEAADVIYVQGRYPNVIDAYADTVVVCDVPPANLGVEPVTEVDAPFSDEYEEDVMRLLSLTVNRLRDALSRVNDLGVLYLARDREERGEGRAGARRVYNEKIRSLGGTV